MRGILTPLLILTGFIILGFQINNSEPSIQENNKQLNDTLTIDSTFSKLLKRGRVLFDQEEYKKAIALADSTLEFIASNDTTIAKYQILIGESYIKLGNTDSSYVYFNKAATQAAKVKDGKTLIRANALHGLGLVTYKKGGYKKASEYYAEAIELKKEILGPFHLDMTPTYNNIGNAYNRQKKYELAKSYYEQCLNIYKKAQKDTTLKASDYYMNLGLVNKDLGNFEIAKQLLNKALKLRIQYLGEHHEKIGYVYNNIGLVYLSKNDYEKANDYLIKAIKIKEKQLGRNHIEVARGLYNLSLSVEEQGKVKEALNYRLEALDILSDKLGEYHPVVGAVTNGLGVSYKNLGEYDLAIDYHKRVLVINSKASTTDEAKNANVNYNIGNVYYSKKEYKKANEYFDLSLELCNKNYGLDHPKTLVIQSGIAKLISKQKDHQKAIHLYKDILRKRIKTNGPNNVLVATTYEDIGIAYEKAGDYEQALSNLNTSLSIRLNKLEKQHPKIAQNYLNIGVSYFRLNELDDALTNFQKAILAITPVGKKQHDYSAIEDLKKLRRIYNWIQRTYQKKVKTNKIYLDTLAHQYQLALALEAYTQKHFSRLSTRQFYMANSISTYEGAIENLFKRNKVNDHSDAFSLSEQTKSRYLSEKLKATNYSTSFGLPDSLRDKEHNLNIDIAYIEKKRFDIDFEERVKNDSLINVYDKQLFELKLEKDQLIETFKTEYKDYYNLRYSQKIISVKEIQKSLLEDHQSLIEYFVADSSVFTFLITRDTFQVFQTKKDFPLHDYVSQLRKTIYTPFADKNISQAEYDSLSLHYPKVAFQLYQKLIQPISKFIPEQSELIIIPDGILGYIPFDALLTAPVENNGNFRDYPYLLEKYQISIAYSATLLKEMRDKKHKTQPTKNFLAVAPLFPGEDKDSLLLAARLIDITNQRNRLGPLNYNISEVKNLQSIISGDLLIDSSATEAAFTKIAGDYRILHLSTHGKANDKAGDYSFLAFYEKEDSLENEWLYNSELYEIELNADMIVLSACETGIGELQRGEGIISLARGFSYAGVKSIITTLWSINDKQTPELMNKFYTYLKAGESKDAALRKAKLEYLQTSTNPEPYFWAAFTPIGDMSPVELNSSWPWWIWGLLLMVVAIGILGFKQFKS